ncbi:iron chaperone [Cellulomonas soli]|uniref:iron chaperone n=1 Tax=Cellulomonas soli TaxID=931535 RepID=UPI003F830D81
MSGTVTTYLTELEPTDADAIGRVYAVAREVVPDVEEGLGYGMPALTYRGKPLLSVMRAAKHIGLYPFSPAAVAAVAEQVALVAGTSTAKGTIRFQPASPLPDAVVRALVTARRDEIDGARA